MCIRDSCYSYYMTLNGDTPDLLGEPVAMTCKQWQLLFVVQKCCPTNKAGFTIGLGEQVQKNRTGKSQ